MARLKRVRASIKHFIEQALLLRASRQFDTLHDYREFIAAVAARANARVLKALSVERTRLQALPKTRSNDYEKSMRA
jgi:hypothetical protein